MSVSAVKVSELEASRRVDAEYYQPDYLLQDARIAGLNPKPLSDLAKVSDGNHIAIEDKFTDFGIRYLRGQDLVDFFISDAKPAFIPYEVYETLKRSHMKSGDVLLSIVGTVGSAALVTDKYQMLTGSCKIAIIRPRSINPHFLAAYLASPSCQAQIQRRIRGAIQQGLILPDLAALPVPSVDDHQAKKVESLVKQAFQQRKNSVSLYAQAQALLTTELGLDGLGLPTSGISTRCLSEVAAVGRIDAEYYHPQKAYVQEWLDKLPGKTIADYFKPIREIYNPPQEDTGKSVLNFDLTDALRYFVDETGPMTPENEIGSTKKRMTNGDVIVSRLRSYLKEIALVEVPKGVESVGSSEFIVLRSWSTEVYPEVLVVYLRSEPVQTILKWAQDGSNHPRFQEDELLSIKLPDRVIQVQDEIRKLIRSGIQAHRAANALLTEATVEVERMIEGK